MVAAAVMIVQNLIGKHLSPLSRLKKKKKTDVSCFARVRTAMCAAQVIFKARQRMTWQYTTLASVCFATLLEWCRYRPTHPNSGDCVPPGAKLNCYVTTPPPPPLNSHVPMVHIFFFYYYFFCAY